MATVQIVDRSEMIRKRKALLEINPKGTVIVTVDMHRGHLDPAVATMPASPEDCERVIRATDRLLRSARAAGVHVVRAVTVQRPIPGLGAEARGCPFGPSAPRWRSPTTGSPGRRACRTSTTPRGASSRRSSPPCTTRSGTTSSTTRSG